MVLAGSPRALTSCGAAALGTDTTFIVVPTDAMRDGMNSAVWLSVLTTVRWGWTMPGSPADSREKTSAMRSTSSSGLNLVVTLKVSDAERTSNDMDDEGEDGGMLQRRITAELGRALYLKWEA